jgi:uncharacterized protein (TIGR00266 family)
MNIDIELGPGSSAAKVSLEAGEHVTAEGGAMIAMSPDMQLTTSTHKKESGGGIFKALKRMVAGESFFVNHYTAGANGGEVYLATALPGDMRSIDLSDEKIICQGGSYVASSPDVEIDLGFQGLKSLFSGEGIFWLNLSGSGKVVINSFGAIYPIEVDGSVIVDTGHIVAFQESLSFKVTKAGGSWISAILGGEGLVCKFEGKGIVWVQSHNTASFGQAMTPSLKARTN